MDQTFTPTERAALDASHARMQQRFHDYVAAIGNGRHLLQTLLGWTSLYAPNSACDIHTLIAALPPKTHREFINAVIGYSTAPSMPYMMQRMVEAGSRLQAGIYGVDEPDTGLIRRGLAYLDNELKSRTASPVVTVALEDILMGVREPFRVQGIPVSYVLPSNHQWQPPAESPAAEDPQRLLHAERLKAALAGDSQAGKGLRIKLGASGGRAA